MLTATLTKIFGSRNSRLLKRLQQDVARINALEPKIAALTETSSCAPRPRSSASASRAA